MEATESTSLLPSSPPSQDGSPSSNRPQLRSHSRGESFVPEFILTSVEKVEDFAHDVTEHVEEMAHDLTTFEIFNLEEHLPEGMDHVPPEYDPLSNELVTDLEDLAEAPDLELIEEIIHPPDPMAASAEKLGVLPLAIMVFYSVSGGPFGCETSVRAGGNFFALLGFLVMPFVWSLQEALMTAELGTVFPEASGGVAWVEEAFGTNMGWMTGYLGWIAGATVCLLLCRHVACSGVNLRRGCLIPRCFIFSHTLTSLRFRTMPFTQFYSWTICCKWSVEAPEPFPRGYDSFSCRQRALRWDTSIGWACLWWESCLCPSAWSL